MARLQILYLPSSAVGDVHVPQFALVVDQADRDLGEGDAARIDVFAAKIGAAGALITPLTLDVADGQDGDDDDDVIVIGWDHREISSDIAEILKQRLEAPSTRDLLSRSA